LRLLKDFILFAEKDEELQKYVLLQHSNIRQRRSPK